MMFELDQIFAHGLTTDVFLIGSAAALALFAAVGFFMSRPSESEQTRVSKASWSASRNTAA